MPRLAADLNMQYYPTNEMEALRMIGLFGNIRFKQNQSIYYFSDILTGEDISFVREKNNRIKGNNYYNETAFLPKILYQYLVKKGEYEKIKQIFEFTFYGSHTGGNADKRYKCVIADLFAGKGEFLSLFRNIPSFAGKESMSKRIHLLANEINENRFNEIKANENINEAYNLAFEDLMLPKEYISLMLFNPPYGSDNGERYVKKYLRLILERSLLCKKGKMVFVINKEDCLNCAELIVSNFYVDNSLVYRMHKEEYDRFKQFVFVGELRQTPLKREVVSDISKICELAKKFRDKIEEEAVFCYKMIKDVDTCNYSNFNYINMIPQKELKDDFKYVKEREKYITDKDNSYVWTDFIKSTTQKDLSTNKVVIAKPPKIGDLSILSASGLINGEIAEDTGRYHIVTGGVKTFVTREYIPAQSEKGSDAEKITKSVMPYLNVMYFEKGVAKIKELSPDSYSEQIEGEE